MYEERFEELQNLGGRNESRIVSLITFIEDKGVGECFGVEQSFTGKEEQAYLHFTVWSFSCELRVNNSGYFWLFAKDPTIGYQYEDDSAETLTELKEKIDEMIEDMRGK